MLVWERRRRYRAGAFRWLAQDEEVFLRIRHVYRKLPAAVFLSGADAIHLATAAEAGFHIIYSNDAHLLSAAKHFSIEGRNVNLPNVLKDETRQPADVCGLEQSAF
jgi:predicted nucleic acid-binding protein